jgi:hypothetical protein
MAEEMWRREGVRARKKVEEVEEGRRTDLGPGG